MALVRVGLFVGRDDAFGRGAIRGLIRYAFPAKRWLFVKFFSPTMFERFDIKGAIGSFSNPEQLAYLRSQNIPLVDVGSWLAEASDLPRVAPDDRAVGRIAAEYFLQRQYTTFVFVPRRHGVYSSDREAAYTEVINAVGHQVHRVDFPEDDSYDRNVIAWLRGLPKPLAVFGADDQMARHMSDMCVQADVNVPQEAAILGVNNDELSCNESYVPISSVELPVETIGYEAGRMLDALMSGEPTPRLVRLPPTRVITRGSSDLTAINDPDVIAALSFIRENCDRPIDVGDVAEATMMGRRTLQTRFQRVLGRTILHEIEHERLERAKQMLVRTDLRIPEIAESAGFASRLQMHRTFQRLAGTTPQSYRALYRFR